MDNVPAALLGFMLGSQLSSETVRWIAGGLFIAMGIFILLYQEESSEDSDDPVRKSGFTTALALVFIGELGDKTQIVTLTEAAKYQMFLPVIAGALTALFLASAMALFVGNRLRKVLKPSIVKPIAAAIFILIGALALIGVV